MAERSGSGPDAEHPIQANVAGVGKSNFGIFMAERSRLPEEHESSLTIHHSGVAIKLLIAKVDNFRRRAVHGLAAPAFLAASAKTAAGSL